ncbi:polysaccharide biosynthesis protein [Agromyces sp. CCNWLW203]|uniref:polysaccharide biosynthesis protein n=1 Tax=Agromyces sp. CCNWLW203 TaxID=3112842 RepID=UPI002F967F37
MSELREPRPRRVPKRVLIAGRGVAGLSLSKEVVAGGDVLVGFLDDHASGDDVLGPLASVAEVCVHEAVDVVYFAIPSVSGETLRDFVTQVHRASVELAIVPRTYRIVSRERVSVSDLTDVDILDLVGRAPVKHDMVHAREVIRGRRVMVTGAAGSIGSRIVAQLNMLEPELIVCVDRSESGMFRLGNSLNDASNARLEIGDVQSEARMGQLMAEYQPDFLFHVAAYKHVPLMQHNPVEAFNNNVWGTLNVFSRAAEHGVANVVYVSSDKAVNPTNVMGATKRLGELLLRDLAAASPSTRFSGVRFGNVLESEGSVMQTFRQQLHQRRNLTVTHAEITRYFMTIDEAAQLVIQTATAGKPGDLFVLDMGEPIRVYDLARGLIEAVDPSLDVDIIGLRPGEKMYEELSHSSSSVDSTTHPKIFIVTDEDAQARGETTEWVGSMLDRTRHYDITAEQLTDAMRDFGFNALQ